MTSMLSNWFPLDSAYIFINIAGIKRHEANISYNIKVYVDLAKFAGYGQIFQMHNLQYSIYNHDLCFENVCITK